jgi:hypothetical protein
LIISRWVRLGTLTLWRPSGRRLPDVLIHLVELGRVHAQLIASEAVCIVLRSGPAPMNKAPAIGTDAWSSRAGRVQPTT